MKKLITDLAITAYSLLRALKNYRHDRTISDMNPIGKDLCVLGNGPSLKDSLTNNIDFISSRTSICVNDFISSSYFELIKPSYYLLLDPAYWRQDSIPVYVQIRDAIFTRLIDSVDWDLTVIIPTAGKNELDWVTVFSANDRIKVAFINVTPVSGFESVRHLMYKYQLGMPRPQNVLVAALYLGINIGYETIYLFGADHSWHEELFVNNDNVVCIKDKHFYDNNEVKAVPFPMYHDSPETPKLHVILDAFAKMFEGYHYIEAYAKYRKVCIYNASCKTFIDAFKRYSV